MSVSQERNFLGEGKIGFFKFNLYEDSIGPYALITHPEIKKPIVASISKSDEVDLKKLINELRLKGLSLTYAGNLSNDIIRSYREAKKTE